MAASNHSHRWHLRCKYGVHHSAYLPSAYLQGSTATSLIKACLDVAPIGARSRPWRDLRPQQQRTQCQSAKLNCRGRSTTAVRLGDARAFNSNASRVMNAPQGAAATANLESFDPESESTQQSLHACSCSCMMTTPRNPQSSGLRCQEWNV